MKKIIQENKKEVFGILNMIFKRDFKGYTGLAIKNSIFQFSTNFMSKIGSLIFMIIIARLLMPELFGLYSLAISTIVLFSSFADLGIDQTMIRFVSKVLAKNNLKKAKAYAEYLIKVKLFCAITVAIILAISAYFIANFYYHKPIFFALIAGSFYILFSSLIYSFEGIFQSSNMFKGPFIKESFFQVLRLIIVPLVILFSIRMSLSNQFELFLIVFSLAICYLFSLVFIYYLAKKQIKLIKSSSEKISQKEKDTLWKFIFSLSLPIFSGIFLGYIDMLMLGRYVSAEFIGYYRAAFSLIGAAAPLIGFSTVLLPIFSRIKGKQLERALNKSIKITFVLSVLGIIVTLILSNLAILIIFGKDYMNSVIILRILSLILITIPINSIYTTYLISKGKARLVAFLLIISTILNLLINYTLIKIFTSQGQFMVTIGVSIATVLAGYIFLLGLFLIHKFTK
jgi:O-antigen/teichoic acid export membrane protein